MAYPALPGGESITLLGSFGGGLRVAIGEPGLALEEGGERSVGAGGARRQEAAPDEGEHLVGGGEGGGRIAELMFEQLGEFDEGGDAAGAWFAGERSPGAGGVFELSEPAVEAGEVVHGLEAFDAAEAAGEGLFVVTDGAGQVSRVLRGAGRLEGKLGAIADSAEVGGEGDEGEDIPGVVAEDGQNVGGVGSPLEAEVAFGDLGGGTVVLPFEAEEAYLHLGQAVRGEGAAKEPAVGVEEVEMGKGTEGGPFAGEDVPGFEEWEVERFAVVADEGAGGFEFAGEAAEEAAFELGIGQQVLAEEEARAFEPGRAGEEDHGAGAAEAGGLCIDVDEAGGRASCKALIPALPGEARGIDGEGAMEDDVAVFVAGVVDAFDDVAGSIR